MSLRPSPPIWQGATACNPMRPETGPFSKPRTNCPQCVMNVRNMTRQALDVSRSWRSTTHWTRTAFRRSCTKTAQRVYAEYPKHPPFTHFAVCSGNILQSCATYCTPLHHGCSHVKPNEKPAETVVLCGFCRLIWRLEQKSSNKMDLCTLVAFSPEPSAMAHRK